MPEAEVDMRSPREHDQDGTRLGEREVRQAGTMGAHHDLCLREHGDLIEQRLIADMNPQALTETLSKEPNEVILIRERPHVLLEPSRNVDDFVIRSCRVREPVRRSQYADRMMPRVPATPTKGVMEERLDAKNCCSRRPEHAPRVLGEGLVDILSRMNPVHQVQAGSEMVT